MYGHGDGQGRKVTWFQGPNSLHCAQSFVTLFSFLYEILRKKWNDYFQLQVCMKNVSQLKTKTPFVWFVPLLSLTTLLDFFFTLFCMWKRKVVEWFGCIYLYVCMFVCVERKPGQLHIPTPTEPWSSTCGALRSV